MDNEEINRLTALAAKAVGGYLYVDGLGWIEDLGNGKRGQWWKPGLDDGDALRLAAHLEIDVLYRNVIGRRVVTMAIGGCRPFVEYSPKESRAKATRLAILRAAAAIGEAMGRPAAAKGE